jgi:TIR domain-containing protein
MEKNVGQKLKVFLCHAPEDEKSARALYRRLSVDRYDVWLNDKSILPGKNRHLEILKAIRSSDIVIICLSKTSILKEGYFQKEIKKALEKADEKSEDTIYIIPVRLDDCVMPERLEELEKADYFDKGGYERLKAALDHTSNLKQENNKQLENPRIIETNPKPKPSHGCELRFAVYSSMTFLGAIFAFIAVPLLWETSRLWTIPCSIPLQDSEIVIRPIRDVKLVSDNWLVGTTIPGVEGMLHPQGSIELSGLDSGKSYFITLNGKPGYLPNIELRKIDQTWKWTEGYWDFMTVTANSIGTVPESYLLGTLPPNVMLCSGQEYRAKFFVKDATYQTILGANDFSFKVESSDSIPYTLNIDISSIGLPNPIPTIQMTNTTPPPTDLSLKGDSLVTVNIKTLNPSGVEISSDTLNYHWELCCDDNQNKTPDDSHLPVWKFKPPTYIPTETLTITVSNSKGYSVEVEIPFKIVPRY